MKQFIKCPECGTVQLAIKEGGIYFQCENCKKIQHTFPEPLPALSIKQPWAWLIVNGYKDIENRNSLMNFTVDFLIHTGKQTDFSNFYAHLIKIGKEAPIVWYDKFPYKMETGGIIGYATITGYVEKSDSPWFVGKYGFLIKDPHPLSFTPCKGRLSFFEPEI